MAARSSIRRIRGASCRPAAWHPPASIGPGASPARHALVRPGIIPVDPRPGAARTPRVGLVAHHGRAPRGLSTLSVWRRNARVLSRTTRRAPLFVKPRAVYQSRRKKLCRQMASSATGALSPASPALPEPKEPKKAGAKPRLEPDAACLLEVIVPFSAGVAGKRRRTLAPPLGAC